MIKFIKLVARYDDFNLDETVGDQYVYTNYRTRNIVDIYSVNGKLYASCAEIEKIHHFDISDDHGSFENHIWIRLTRVDKETAWNRDAVIELMRKNVPQFSHVEPEHEVRDYWNFFNAPESFDKFIFKLIKKALKNKK